MRKTGRCMCGAIRFEGPLTGNEVLICHCEQCRRFSGHVWAAVTMAADQLEIDGRDALGWRRCANTEWGFCLRCGASLFWRADGSPDVSVGAGALDDSAGLRVAAEIYVAEKAAYNDCAGAIELYSRNRDEPPFGRK